MKVIIVGAGDVGRTLSGLLAAEKHEVTIVEINNEKAKNLAQKMDAMVLAGDGTDISILKDAGVETSDALVATTSDDKSNFMICEVAKSVGVKKIVSVINTPKNEELFTKLGITQIVSSVRTTVTNIKRLLYESGEEHVITQLGEGEVQVIEISVQKESRLLDKPASIPGAVIGTIYRNGELIIPNEKSLVKIGDVLIIFVKKGDLQKVKALTGG